MKTQQKHSAITKRKSIKTKANLAVQILIKKKMRMTKIMKINQKIGLSQSTLRTRPAATSTWPCSASIQLSPSMTVCEASQKSLTMSLSMSDPAVSRSTLSRRWWWLRCYTQMKTDQQSLERRTQSRSNITLWPGVLAKSTTWLCRPSILFLIKQLDRSSEAIWLWALWSTYTSVVGRCRKRIIGTETPQSLKTVTNSFSPTSCLRYTRSQFYS